MALAGVPDSVSCRKVGSGPNWQGQGQGLKIIHPSHASVLFWSMNLVIGYILRVLAESVSSDKDFSFSASLLRRRKPRFSLFLCLELSNLTTTSFRNEYAQIVKKLYVCMSHEEPTPNNEKMSGK